MGLSGASFGLGIVSHGLEIDNVAGPQATFEINLDATTYDVATTATVSGGITIDETVTGVTVTLTRKKKSDGSVIATLINTSVDFTVGVQKTWAAMLGSAVTFAPATAQSEYLEATLDGGSPAPMSATSGKTYYSVRATTRPTITVAWLSATSCRVTITNGAGLTNRVYYSSKADALATPISGGSRSGNGTVDITGMTSGMVAWVVAVGDSGTYTLLSNVYEINLATGGGGATVMGMGLPFLRAQPEVIDDDLNEPRIRCVYDLGQLTLAQANLEQGDYLPENTDKGIPASTYEVISVFRNLVQKTGAWEARIVARMVRAFEQSGP